MTIDPTAELCIVVFPPTPSEERNDHFARQHPHGFLTVGVCLNLLAKPRCILPCYELRDGLYFQITFAFVFIISFASARLVFSPFAVSSPLRAERLR